jgi:hypothetical protein
MESSVCPPSPLNTYSNVQDENLGSTRKFVKIYLLFTCISNQILALSTWKKVPPDHAQQVYLEEPTRLPIPP